MKEKSKSIKNKKVLSQRFELCQVLRDIIDISEETDWNLRSCTKSIYRSIGAYIQNINYESEEFNNLKNIFLSNLDNKDNFKPKILNIYKIVRPNECFNFNKSGLSNIKLLYHGSNVNNFVGILSRGLLLPKYITKDELLSRTDIGLLGYGIYFTDNLTTSIKYTKPSIYKNTRLISVCSVALGNCIDYHDFDISLTKAPDGYESVHGVSVLNDPISKFKDEQFVIYNTNQYKLDYLIELQCQPLDGDIKKILNSIIDQKNENHHLIDYKNDNKKNINDYLNGLTTVNPKYSDLTSSLKTSNGKNLPLKSVHVRTRLVDMIAKVVIYQEYENDEIEPIEAKYIFPLNDQATVCGFECFINDKHIIGVCKEKEKAHKEYKKAIEKGKGAYLIDQETNELFKVNIGNLPPKCKCFIKITYITELEVYNDLIYFKLPNSISSWQLIKNEREKLQNSVISRFINKLNKNANKSNASFIASIQMPFEIRSIDSPSHELSIKKTACLAVCRVENTKCSSNNDHDNSLILTISIATIHMPRMFVEDYLDPITNKTSRACMVSFYPEFDTSNIKQSNYSPTINFLFDCSNSMKENGLIEKSKLLGLLMLNKYMPASSLFNIILFGSDYIELFPFALNYNQINLNKANEFVFNNMNKFNTRGNTDLLNVLRPYIKLNLKNQNFILLSDGHLSRYDDLLQTLNQNNNKAKDFSQSYNFNFRIFTCSVGNISNNNHLLKMIGRLTNASYEVFDSKLKSKWNEKCRDLMDKILQPAAITDIKIEWQNMIELKDEDESFSYLQSPSKIGALFNGRRITAYAFCDNCSMATLRAKINGYDLNTVVTCPELNITQGDLIHKLVAKSVIGDWQYGIQIENDKIEDNLKKLNFKNRIINLSKKYSITSEYTSFIAIEDRDKDEYKNMSQNLQTNIQEFLNNDKDSNTIDLLPYMQYEIVEKFSTLIDDEEIGVGENHERNLIGLFRNFENNYDTLNEMEKAEFYNYIIENKTQIEDKLDNLNPIRLKLSLYLAKEFSNKNEYAKSMAILKSSFDNAISSLDSLSEESYRDANILLEQIRNEINLINSQNRTHLFVKTLTGKII